MLKRTNILPHLWVVLLIGFPFFFWGGPGYYSSRFFQNGWDLGHILFFAIASLWLHALFRAKVAAWSPIRTFCALFVVVLFVGSLVEFLQMFVDGRTPDFFDVLRNQAGCLLACAFFIHPSLFSGLRRQLFQLGVIVLLGAAVWPTVRSLIDERLAAQQFPILADFETPFERYRWVNIQQLRQESAIVRHGAKAIRVQLSTAKYSGVSLFYFPGDWRGFHTLHWSVYNPQPAALVLNCRIHDVHHKEHGLEYADRFNQQFIVQQGWNDLAVSLERVKNAPKGRAMDMQHIEGFGLFVVQQPSPMEIYLDHVYLDK